MSQVWCVKGFIQFSDRYYIYCYLFKIFNSLYPSIQIWLDEEERWLYKSQTENWDTKSLKKQGSFLFIINPCCFIFETTELLSSIWNKGAQIIKVFILIKYFKLYPNVKATFPKQHVMLYTYNVGMVVNCAFSSLISATNEYIYFIHFKWRMLFFPVNRSKAVG